MICNKFKIKSANDSLEILIQFNSAPSVSYQIAADKSATNIRNYFCEKCQIKSELIITNIEVSDEVGYKIMIQKKGIFK